MGSMISIDEKKEFLKWFLNTFQLKRRECAWLLNYLISDDAIMERVHFVNEAEFCPKGMVISTIDVDKIPFCYYRQKHITLDAEKAFHDIRLNSKDDVYIQLNFPNSQHHARYIAVLEDNPYSPKKMETELSDQLFVDLLLDHLTNKFKKELLMKEIDRALELGDKETFMKLTEKLNNESY